MRTVLLAAVATLMTACAVTRARDRERAIGDDPPLLRAITTANEVYIFPINTPRKPHRDDTQRRLLPPDARREIIRLLSDGRNWWHGGLSLVLPPLAPGTRDIGLIFIQNRNELVLFFDGMLVSGTFNGQHTDGLFGAFDQQKMDTFERWKARYAHPELASERRPN